MRIRLSIDQHDGTSRDAVVTADVTATVADIAAHLAPASDDRLTLRALLPGSTQWRVLDPAALVHESGLRSGCRVEAVPVGTRRRGDDVAAVEAALGEVVAGPDAGRRFTLSPGVNTVGRCEPARVLLDGDEQVSARHASITVGETITITDLNSANGLQVDGRLVHRAVVSAASRIRLGSTTLRIVPLTHGASPAVDDGEFVRSPRVEAAYRGEEIVLPETPSPGERPRFPMLAVLAPIVLGLVLFLLTKQLYSLVFVALSPVMMLGSWIDGRARNAHRTRDETRRFNDGIADAERRLREAESAESTSRRAESPSATEVLSAIAGRTDLLWTRKPEHSTFLEVRFGTGELASRTRVRMPSKNTGGIAEWRRAEELADRFEKVAPVPVVENFTRAGAIGVAGTGSIATDAARALVLQLVGLHSPADLVVTALAAGEATARWEWLKWLPHVDSPYSPLRAAGLADDFASAGALLADLEGLVARRREDGRYRGTVRSRLDEHTPLDAEHGEAVEALPATPAILVIVTAHAPAERARLVALAEDGPDAGVFVLWFAETVRALPVACRTYLEVDERGRAAAGYVRSGVRVALPAPELVDAVAAATAARALAPLRDTGARVLDETDLPHSVAFFDLYEDQVADDPDAVVRRWVKNGSVNARWVTGAPRAAGGIRAVVGQGPDEPFALDLREHGPHALVGGTTGAGKSEFLQTWLMGVATEYSPDRVTFLLVDYKGGAAFAECVTLPHTVGLVTDLTPHLVHRALTSLRAELRHRERLLNAKGAKDLQTLEARSDPDAPPALIIVIDEFAALAGEVPEFVDGVIDVAQRGRSLGLHLVMATQRPSGVIKDSLRANTNLRVALRVADEADSVDVLGAAGAAFFDPGTPGRAAAKTGPGRVHDFQSAYLGGRSRQGPGEPDVQVRDLPFGPGEAWPTAASGADEGGPRDIERLADTIARAADACAIAVPRKPWLDALPARVPIDDLPSGAVGLLDEPEAQQQVPFVVPFDEAGTIAVIGTSGSGRSTVLRSIAHTLSAQAVSVPVAIYALDFAGGALRMLEALPTVGAVVTGGDKERVRRLIRQLGDEVERRAGLVTDTPSAAPADHGAATRDGSPRIVLLVDGFAAFRTEYEFEAGGRFFDAFLALASTGRRLGIDIVMTADRPGAFPTALSAVIGLRIVLRLAGENEYAAAGVPVDALVDAPPGRALVDGHEVQFATAEATDPSGAVDDLATRLRAAGVPSAAPVRRLPELIPAASLPADLDGAPILGVGDETLAPVALPTDGMFVVTGPFGSGRSTAMRTAVQALRTTHAHLAPHLIVGRRSSLADATDWAEASTDADSADVLASTLAARLEGPADERPAALIVVENAGDFADLPAEASVARLLKAARRSGTLVLAEADTVTAPAAWQLFTELKSARAGIVLQPDEGDGLTLFRTPFPRVTRADFPVGRGILVDAGRITRMHVAYPADIPEPA